MRIARSLGKRNTALQVDIIAVVGDGAEGTMTHMEIKALEDAGRTSMVWSTEGYDGETHYSYVLKALAPALFVIASAAAVMLFIL